MCIPCAYSIKKQIYFTPSSISTTSLNDLNLYTNVKYLDNIINEYNYLVSPFQFAFFLSLQWVLHFYKTGSLTKICSKGKAVLGESVLSE